MSLIVARKFHEKFYILGDTELTCVKQEKRNPFIQGCLKQYIISDDLAICFAGVKEHFEDVCKTIFSFKDPLKTASFVKNEQKNGLDFELLIASLHHPNFFIIKNGEITETEAGYLGSLEAFESFQKYFHSEHEPQKSRPEVNKAVIQFLRIPEPTFENDIYSKLFDCFKRVIWNSKIEGVGGVIVPLCSDKSKFSYINYTDIVSDPLKLEEFSINPKPISFGTPQGGGYAVEFSYNSPLSPLGGDGKEVGYYFLQGGFGVIFPENEKDFRNAQLVKALNPALWALETHKIFKNGITSGFTTPDHCGVAGEKLLKEGKYNDALFCYELQKNSKQFEGREKVRDRYFAGFATALFNCGDIPQAVKILLNEIGNYNAVCCAKILQTICEIQENRRLRIP